MLESRTLRYFIAVAQDLHFGRAAERLNVAQSAVSVQVQKLEEQFGTPLLRRGKRAAVHLTEAGRLFLPEALLAIQQLERTERIGRLAGRGEIGHIELAYVASAALAGVLPNCLRQFRHSHPDVQLSISLMETPRQIAALTEGRIDVALIRPRPHYPTGITADVLHHEGLCIAVAQDHPLSAKPFISAAELRDEMFLIPQFDENTGFGASLTRLADVGGFTAAATHTLHDFVTALSMAAGGYGVVLGPVSMRQHGISGVVFRPIADFTDEVGLAIAYRTSESSAAARAFASLIRDIARSSA